ncbi:FAD-binding oxidoreductase [Anaerococcus sp. mt242]|uniref:NAD(P)/FAD-dependent oxidoreductase n=1 Tax=Anaerococcus sp. mt242 TaxID=2661917 RepID=UPI0019323515|nr:FAD-dependent oxidoreductase [Anaerococcus sp. mt242]MBM0046029.1 FAD-binding oxidoreductase [Anaerococcus sp. mt242]
MKLHTGKLYWPANTEAVCLNINNNITDNSDVLVVGSGMSGALAAYELSKNGHKVTLIEQNRIASGSTSANTGLIQYMSDQGVKSFAKQIGTKKAVKFYNQSKEAVADLIKIEKQLVDLDQETFKKSDSLILATDKKKIKDVKDESTMQKEIGYDVEYLNEKELEELNINAYGALKCGPDINLNPYAFVLRLLKTASEKYNLDIVEGVRFIEAIKENCENIVSLEIAGEKLEKSYKKIVIATGYNPPVQLKKSLKNVEIYKTYVAVSQVIDISDREDYLTWEVKDAYTYFKKTFDSRLMIGGFDEKGDKLKEKDAIKYEKDLIKGANLMFVDKKDMTSEYNYAALFGISKDNLPYMGVDPDNKDIFVVCGVGGNGTVYSKIASTMISKWINGESLDDYETYRLAR